MSTRTTLAALAVAAAVFIAAGGGIPRLLGTGCSDRPLGVALAREESDFTTTCSDITPIWP